MIDSDIYGNVVQLQLPDRWLQFLVMKGFLHEATAFEDLGRVYELTPKGSVLLGEVLQLIELLAGEIEEVSSEG